MNRMIVALTLVLLAIVPGNTSEREVVRKLTCQSDEMAWLSTQLFFGRSISPKHEGGPAGHVSDDQWRDFRKEHITPRFPDGYTLINGKGHWMDGKTGRQSAEDSKILILLHTPDETSENKIQEIRNAYKKAFDQQSVLRSVSATCIQF